MCIYIYIYAILQQSPHMIHESPNGTAKSCRFSRWRCAPWQELFARLEARKELPSLGLALAFVLASASEMNQLCGHRSQQFNLRRFELQSASLSHETSGKCPFPFRAPLSLAGQHPVAPCCWLSMFHWGRVQHRGRPSDQFSDLSTFSLKLAPSLIWLWVTYS